jgi:hypothetical protein
VALHKTLGYTETHIAYSLEYADATARTSASLASSDIGRIARQASDGTFWIVKNNSPLAWIAITDTPAGTVPTSRTITAGAGLTGGGDLSSDRTIDVVANVDGSIVVNANDIQVGVINDTQHGTRSGGSTHSVATTSVAGFQSAADKVKTDDISRTTMSWGNTSVSSTATTRYLTPGWGDNIAPVSPIQFRAPKAGTLRNLYIRHNSPAGNGNNIVYTVRVNGVATSLTVTLACNSSDANDTAHTVAVAQGDRLDIEVTKSVSIATSPSDVSATLDIQE